MAQIRDWVAANPGCTPPSIHQGFSSEVAAIADSPRAGDLYQINGRQFWYDGTNFQPVGPDDRIVIPDTAFANPAVPTVAEVDAYVAANFPNYTPGTLIVLEGAGTADNPDYVWITDTAGVTVRIESPAGSNPVAVVDIHDVQTDFQATTGGYGSHVRTNGRTINNYEWVVREVGGATLRTISGPGDNDASGEFGVVSGTYKQPTWENLGLCGDIEFCLTVTDSAGEVSEQNCETFYDYGITTLYFQTSGTTFNATVAFTDGYVAEWNLGDGTAPITSNTVNQVFATPGSHQVTARVCLPTLSSISAAGQNIGGTLDTIFADAPISTYPVLTLLELGSNQIGGTIPADITNSVLERIILNNNSLTGTIPELPPTIEYFNVNFNALSGALPSFANNPNLDTLYAISNSLTGPFPDMANNPLLEIYNLNNNGLSGTLPSFANNPLLRDLQIPNNEGTGALPSFANNPALETFSVSSNEFSGEIPDFTNNPVLRFFVVSQNNFTGRFPDITSTVLEQIFAAFQEPGFFTSNMPDPNDYPVLTDFDLLGAGFDGLSLVSPVNVATLTRYRAGTGFGIDLVGNIPDFSGSTALVSITINADDIDYVAGSLDNNANLTEVFIRSCNLTSAMVDNILCDVDTSGAVNGTMDIRNVAAPLAPPTAVGLACQANLVTKGWTIATD